MRAKRGHGAKQQCFYFVLLQLRSRRFTKTKWVSLYLACKSLLG
nr:hypothetical protein [Campylobacter troglodytis]